ncbi:MAG: hypothetical protein E6Q94_10935 [Burkholderiaceae bacterium]|nr:MAG: hypothetical protein E6Q94_10935 [Burkholderiaceae bacterium]
MKTADRELPIDEARWQAQERARLGDAGADDGDLRIARALRQAPDVALPMDFARQVAALARQQAAVTMALEQRLLQVLLVVLAVSTLVALVWFGRTWLAGLAALLPGGEAAAGWCLVAMLCGLLNWGLGQLRGVAVGSWRLT